MFIKYFMLAFSTLAFRQREQISPESQAERLDALKNTIRAEVSSIGLKFMLGLVFVAAIIFSLVQLGNTLQILFAQLTNGLEIELASFGAIALLSLLFLSLLFKNKSAKLEVNTAPPAPPLAPPLPPVFEPKILAFSFLQGLHDGFRQQS